MSDSLLPVNSISSENAYGLSDAFTYATYESFTHKLNVEDKTVAGYVDDLAAYKQAVIKILNTERYEHVIYSDNYGIELKSLFGQHIAYVVPELQRRITEAIEQDDRTQSVSDFEFDTSKFGVVAVKFKATSIYGETELKLTVEI